jgi:inward rectifier potassium channel
MARGNGGAGDAGASTPRPPHPPREPGDLGFGSVVSRESRRRLLNRDGSFNVERQGLGYFSSLSLYHSLLSVSWPKFLGLIAVFYLAANGLFAALYLLAGPGTLTGPGTAVAGERYVQAFFFSVQTFATIGYGQVAPVGLLANSIVTVESLTGLLSLAVAAGLLFARIARPTARVLFSDVAVIAPYAGGTGFMFRVANARKSQLFEVEAKVTFSRLETANGRTMRNYFSLELERSSVMFFTHYWTVVHPIDEGSPLAGMTAADLEGAEGEFFVLLSGVEETFAQTVHARSSYKPSEVIWRAKFTDIFDRSIDDGVVRVRIDRLSAIDRLDAPADAAHH